MDLSTLNLTPILPEIIILGTALLILLTDFVGAIISSRESSRSHMLALLSLAGLLIAGGFTVFRINQPAADFQGMVLDDVFSRYLNLIILLAGVLGVLLSWEYLTRFTTMHSEYYSLLLLAIAGMMFMGKSIELITLFVSLEILSVSLYVLTGFHRGQLRSAEAALKYFLLGAFSSGFLLYGMALLYADVGSTRLADLATNSTGGFLALAGLALLLVGFGFKIGLAPFHMWVPDAYQGAPTPVTAFMSVGTKAAALLAISRVVMHMTSISYFWWAPALAFLAVLTMTWGNLAALRQSSLKRMLAYSSIAQAGYMFIGLTTGTLNGIQAMLYYLFAYAFMNIGAFAVVALMERIDPEARQDATFDNARGLFSRHPALAVTMAIFMLSLAGIPPLAGFFGKLFLFGAAVQSGWVWLAIAGVLNSVISAFYYLRVTVVMFMDDPTAETRVLLPIPKSAVVGLTLALLGTALFGLFASPWFTVLSQQVAAAQAGG